MTALGLSEGPEDRPARPPVHYQIAVTGRQAGFFFLLLLAALALAFFFGMKTGAAARKGSGAVESLAGASDLPVPTLVPSDGARDTRKAGTSAEKAAEETLGFAAEKRAALKEAAIAAATPVPVASPVATTVPTTRPPTPAAPPARATEASPRVATAEKTPAKAPTKGASGPFFVQVLATRKAPAADDLMKRLKSEGFAADVSPVPGKDGWFRVRVGPFKDRAKAEATAKKIKSSDKQIKNTPMVVP